MKDVSEPSLTTWDPGSGAEVFLDSDSELSCVPACWGLGVHGKCCVALENPASTQMLCAGFPGQGAPPESFGPDCPHEPSASWGKEGEGVFCSARQGVANPELYFFSCHHLSFVLATITWGRLLVPLMMPCSVLCCS